VPEICTCGAHLPADARFCHKCGKPQREEPLLEEAIEPGVVVPEAIPAAPPPPPPINLRNGAAVRAALISCAVVLLLSVILGPFGLGLLALITGGFFAVYLYRRRTGQRISVLNGMRLGWISGIFVFTLTIIFLTLTEFALSQPEFAAQLREQMIKGAYTAEDVTKLFESLRSPSSIGLLLLDGFVSSTLLMSLGAAGGAWLLERRSNS
jgi:hypothetical protein